jgi:hypothetical protein
MNCTLKPLSFGERGCSGAIVAAPAMALAVPRTVPAHFGIVDSPSASCEAGYLGPSEFQEVQG